MRPALRTSVCELFGIDLPIILAGMGGVAGPELTAAVTNAGGLGVLGAGGQTPDELDAQIAQVRVMTSGPFGVDTLIPSRNPKTVTLEEILDRIPPAYLTAAQEIRTAHGLPEGEMPRMQPWFSAEFYSQQMEVILDNRVPVYAAALGNPVAYVPRLREAGTKVISLVGNVRNAEAVVADGVDAVVAQGYDAGGHTGSVGTLSLIPSVVRAVGARVPVIAAGGISSGQALVAALALGASAGWIGTRFLVAEESGLVRGQQEALLGLDSEDVTLTRYRTGKPARMVRTPLISEFESRGLPPLAMPEMRFLSDMVFNPAESVRRYDLATGFAGQALSALTKIQPAAEIMADLMSEVESTVTRLAG